MLQHSPCHNSMKVANNAELRDYLISLSELVKSRGSAPLAELLLSISNMALDWPGTEFLGESRIALRRVLSERLSLTEMELRDLRDVLAQLDTAFEKR